MTDTFRDVQPTQFLFKEPVKNSKGGMNAYIDTSKTNRRCPRFQLSEKMRVPFGIRASTLDGDGSDNPRKNMEVSVDDEDLQAFIRNLDTLVVDVAAKNSKSWFKKSLTAEALAATLYRPTAVPDASGRFAPLLRLKVNGPGSKRPTRIFVATPRDDGGIEYKQGTIDDCPPQSHVTPIVELGGMWFVSKGFGLAINCTDLLVSPAARPQAAFPFVVSDPVVGNPSAPDAAPHGAEDGLPDAM